MQTDASPIEGTSHARLGFLVRQFLRAIEAQHQRDADLIAGLERVARNPRVRHIIRGILQESEHAS
jgi:hypothetical protein